MGRPEIQAITKPIAASGSCIASLNNPMSSLIQVTYRWSTPSRSNIGSEGYVYNQCQQHSETYRNIEGGGGCEASRTNEVSCSV